MTRSIPAQVRLAFGPCNRLGSFLALYFGGLVPLTVWWVTHRELDPNQPVWNQPLTIIVLAGLAFSAVKVAKWARVAFGNWIEAVGFVVLMEGTMTYARTEWLSITVLVGLVFINAVSTACSLADEEAQTRTADEDLPQTDGFNLSSFQIPQIQVPSDLERERLVNMTPDLVPEPDPEPIPEKVLEAAETMSRQPLLKRTRRPRVRS